ncbi:MAG: hemolysin family protein [Butyrivibrio sp.]|nr:hemolysin family protein [Butyrivibrio sp.]
MLQTTVIQAVILLILLILSGYFSSAETALTTVNKVRIKSLADEGNKKAKAVLKISDRYQKMLSTVLIGNNIVNLTASSLSTVIVTNLWGGYMVGISTGVLTFAVLLFGEIVPKTMASNKAEKIALNYAGSLLFLMKVLTPLVWFIDIFAGFFLRLMHVERGTKVAMTENELKTYVAVSHEDGVIESGEKKIIYNVFDFSDSVARDVMIPRIDMSCVSADASYEEVAHCFREDMYTRIPVYEDNQDNIIGLVNIKDLFFVSDRNNFHVKDYLRQAYYTYEYKKTSDLMLEMREHTWSVAFVLNEYGATVGMITLEDLLEEIVGEIRDEYDSDEEEMIRDLGDHRYLIEGSMKLDDINDALNMSLDSEDYDSIGGLMIEHLDRLPYSREKITLDNGIMLEARGVKKHRVEKVLMTVPESIYRTDNENEETGKIQEGSVSSENSGNGSADE